MRKRLVPYLGVFSQAIDLAMGQSKGWIMKSAIIASRLTALMNLSPKTRSEVHYIILLRHIGCSSSSELESSAFGDEIGAHSLIPFLTDESKIFDLFKSMSQVFGDSKKFIEKLGLIWKLSTTGRKLDFSNLGAIHCDIAQIFAGKLNLSVDMQAALGQSYELYNGSGRLGLRHDEIELSVRVATCVLDYVLFLEIGGVDFALEIIKQRSGKFYDPFISEQVLLHRIQLDESIQGDLWKNFLDSESTPHILIDEKELDIVFSQIAHFSDLKSSYFSGQSYRIFELSSKLAPDFLDAQEMEVLGQASLCCNLGRVSVSTELWNKKSNLQAHEYEKIKLYPHHTESILQTHPDFKLLSQVCGEVQERADGSGYFRGIKPRSKMAEILSISSYFISLTSARPHRAALDQKSAITLLEKSVHEGKFSILHAKNLISTLGKSMKFINPKLPFDLTPRELDVLHYICRGFTNNEMAKKLKISPKTVGHHIERLYDKISCSTRVDVLRFAMEHKLV